MKLFLNAQTKVNDGAWENVYGLESPIEITGIQTCQKCHSILVNGNHRYCLCGNALIYSEPIPGSAGVANNTSGADLHE